MHTFCHTEATEFCNSNWALRSKSKNLKKTHTFYTFWFINVLWRFLLLLLLLLLFEKKRKTTSTSLKDVPNGFWSLRHSWISIFVKKKINEHKALDFSSYGFAYPLATRNPTGKKGSCTSSKLISIFGGVKEDTENLLSKHRVCVCRLISKQTKIRKKYERNARARTHNLLFGLLSKCERMRWAGEIIKCSLSWKSKWFICTSKKQHFII